MCKKHGRNLITEGFYKLYGTWTPNRVYKIYYGLCQTCINNSGINIFTNYNTNSYMQWLFRHFRLHVCNKLFEISFYWNLIKLSILQKFIYEIIDKSQLISSTDMIIISFKIFITDLQVNILHVDGKISNRWQ